MFFQENGQYRCAAYLRLSRSDGDQQESNSIKNQRALLNDYLGKHPELHKVDEYVDDGYSGTNFERPDFKRMMQDIENRKINCIIVKDLSRFGRNYIETGRYLERIFPFMGVRFIAINDHYDSAEENDDKGRILIPFNNLINDTYCRDISMRVRSHLDVKRKEGQFIGSFAGYGYQKDPKDKNHLIIDEYAAGIVQEIFKLKLNGMSAQHIANHLNELGVLPPNEYKRASGFNYTCGFRAGLNQKWTVVSVNRILKNESYTGTLIQGKRRKINYKIKKSQDVGTENWIRVEGTHDAIISRGEFQQVQQLMELDTRTSPSQKTVYPLSGFLRCADCGQNMIRRTVTKKGKKYTQILQIHNYIKEHPELTLTDTYVDNGFTGTNFDRPEFERMMQDVRTGKIQCIVVKDLSRFGRDYIETGNYLETIFPMLHIRFIAINDDFDNIRQSDVDSLAVPIKNMVNSLYAKDISKKIGLSYQMRREKGIPTSWCVPYGYRMNEQKSQYEVADEAKYVKLIYQWYLMGLSTNEIARRLEFLEVPRPNEHLNRRLHEGHDTTFNKWHSSSVLRILDSQVYIGNLVTGKTRTASYKGIGLHPVDKEEWHIVENAHEAIILKSDFEIVQEKRNRNKEKRNNAMARSEQVRAECRNHFAGMVFCGCCRRNMTFVRQVHRTEEESYFGVFQCKRKKGTTPCSYHTVPEKMLMMVAMKQIHHRVSTMCEEEKMVKEMLNNGGLDSTRSIKVKESSIACRIQETEERRLRLYEDYKTEILDEEEYSQLKEHYIAEKQRLEHELQKQRQRSLELEKRMRICDEQMERMRAILNQKEFDEELVHELIKKIYVGIDNSVEIEFKCSDPYQEVLAFVAEVQNE